jgi:hypothetical protein
MRSRTRTRTSMLSPTHRVGAVYHKQPLSVRARAYLSKSLSRSFASTAMSDRYGTMSSAFQRARVRNSSSYSCLISGRDQDSLRTTVLSRPKRHGQTTLINPYKSQTRPRQKVPLINFPCYCMSAQDDVFCHAADAPYRATDPLLVSLVPGLGSRHTPAQYQPLVSTG